MLIIRSPRICRSCPVRCSPACRTNLTDGAGYNGIGKKRVLLNGALTHGSIDYQVIRVFRLWSRGNIRCALRWRIEIVVTTSWDRGYGKRSTRRKRGWHPCFTRLGARYCLKTCRVFGYPHCYGALLSVVRIALFSLIRIKLSTTKVTAKTRPTNPIAIRNNFDDIYPSQMCSCLLSTSLHSPSIALERINLSS
jgi:hypothetical protein